MRLVQSAVLALQAASAIVAQPATPGAGDADFAELQNLVNSAYEQSKVEADLEKRDGSCSWRNVRVRREW